ncbi:hypothetical protein HYQ46_006260 [Verticillium longisporum]|nr:hypothetical protein HYQ46_006260 [Verticillium longisporum]
MVRSFPGRPSLNSLFNGGTSRSSTSPVAEVPFSQQRLVRHDRLGVRAADGFFDEEVVRLSHLLETPNVGRLACDEVAKIPVADVGVRL